MARRPSNPYGSPFKPAKAPKPPAQRRPDIEEVVCRAVREKRVLSFRYKDTDRSERLFAPHVAWQTEDGGACVYGFQLQSEAGIAENSNHNFTIAMLRGAAVTIAHFTVDPRFDRLKFRERVICIVD